MSGAIDRIISSYQMRAHTISILLANTQKALQELAPCEEVIIDAQQERLNTFVRSLTTAVSDRLTRLWFLKERKQRKGEAMTNEEITRLSDFANFVKTLTEDVRSLATRSVGSSEQTFEQEFEKEIQKIGIYVRKRLKEFDVALDRKNDTFKSRLTKSARGALGHFRKSLMGVASGEIEYERGGH
jgi:hypothetical protein